jgi:hypothetical protein
LLYKYFDLHINELKDYVVLLSLIYAFIALLIGFIIQDVGSRIEMILDRLYCKNNEDEADSFSATFESYLFNQRKEDYIVTHYYRSMLIRMKFELHTCASIVLLWVGSFLRAIIDKQFHWNFHLTFWFVLISAAVFAYLLIEAYDGVETLHYYRKKINEEFSDHFKT